MTRAMKRYRSHRFLELYDCDGRGLWFRYVEGRRYHVVEAICMTEGGETAEELRAQNMLYVVDLKEIDLDLLSEKDFRAALSCAGPGGDKYGTPEVDDDTLVEALAGCGLYSPLYQESGNNRKMLVRAVKAESRRLEQDQEAYESAMTRPVNALGSTAREFGQGDLHSAIHRGIAKGDPRACLVGKMHGMQGEVCMIPGKDGEKVDKDTETSAQSGGGDVPGCAQIGVRTGMVRVGINKVPSDDPLAYFAGFSDAVSGRGKADKTDVLASAYLEGYREGVDVKANRKLLPSWFKPC